MCIDPDRTARGSTAMIDKNTLPGARTVGNQTALTARRHWGFTQLIFAEALAEINRVLTAAGIAYMPLKGAYLIESGLATAMKERGMCDIDILVAPEDFDRAMGSFGVTGYAPVVDNDLLLHRHFDLSAAGTTVDVELHYRIRPECSCVLPAADLFQRGRPAKGTMVLPSAEDGLAITILHQLNDLPFWPPDQALRDIEVQVSSFEIDWAKFWEIAESTGTAAFIFLLLRHYGKLPDSAFRVSTNGLMFQYAERLVKWRFFENYRRIPFVFRRTLVEFPFMKSPGVYLLRKLASWHADAPKGGLQARAVEKSG